MVYLAGPYSQPDPAANTHRTIAIADALLDAGFVPFVPHLSLLWQSVSPKPVSAWLDYDRELLARCDALLRIPGPSEGASAEVWHALSLGMPIVVPVSADPADCVDALDAWLANDAG